MSNDADKAVCDACGWEGREADVVVRSIDHTEADKCPQCGQLDVNYFIQPRSGGLEHMSKERLLRWAADLERRSDSVPLYRDDGGVSLERRAKLLDLADMIRREAATR